MDVWQWMTAILVILGSCYRGSLEMGSPLIQPQLFVGERLSDTSKKTIICLGD